MHFLHTIYRVEFDFYRRRWRLKKSTVFESLCDVPVDVCSLVQSLPPTVVLARLINRAADHTSAFVVET